MDKFLNNGTYSLLLDAVNEGSNVSVFGLNMGEKLALVKDSAFLFYVVENIDMAYDIADTLSDLGRTCEILTEVVDPFSSEFTRVGNHLKVLNKINSGDIDTVILTPEMLAVKFPKKDFLRSISLKAGDSLNLTNFINTFNMLGYKRVDLVSEEGDFSVRGDIVDIYPFYQTPIRILVDYDEIESIKTYNPITMLTTNQLDQLNIESSKFLVTTREDILKEYLEAKVKPDNLQEELLELSAQDFRLMLFGDKYCNIYDYVEDATIVFDGAKVIYDKLQKYIEGYNSALLNLQGFSKTLLATKKLNIKKELTFSKQSLIAFHYIVEANRIFNPEKVFSVRTLPRVNYNNFKDAFVLDIANYASQNYTVILCVKDEENQIKYSSILDKSNIRYQTCKQMSFCVKGGVNLLQKNYPIDVILPEEKLAIISTTSLLGKRKKVIDTKVNFFEGELPQNGDYVVHNFHGVGKCLGVETLKLSNSLRDYVVISYKNNDKLYLPVENIDQITKYLGSDKEPNLNKIGGVEFKHTKAKIKSAVKKIAFDLIALYRERKNLKGYVYPEDDELQVQFERNFEFNETIDQLKAINDCKQDMLQGKVMDRLVCGDVGFGKTEVALRIAFKTIMSGKQVALLCPTTILSEQHFNTAKHRMAEFGVKVEVLNRLKTPQEVENIKNLLKDGKIDLICGTHKLLGKDIEFKNLGLLILDEEQKFGVADKEKIKNIKKSINVLTLSATPIPRTLNMSLIGVRDISVIETPPVVRVSSNVQVLEYNDELVKNAINRELSRNGQVLVIFNRVEHIYKFSAYLRNLVPEAIISVAHGQMTDVELEQEIFKLYSGKTQVLVATTLIENGVDLPNANTLIVVNADKLGLSQLYQLKGRIGRSNRDSYAYFTFDNSKILSENAYKRLGAIQEFSEMGSGFKIAMRDLEIRGAGSLLGAEQSGHMEKIGYNMYVQILNDSIKELNNEKVTHKSNVTVVTNISAYLSHNYVSSTTARMKIYTDIAKIDTLDKMLEQKNNLENIYGDIPDELINLLKIAYIKNMASLINAEKVIIKDKCSIVLASKEALTQDIVAISMDNFQDYISFNFLSNPSIEINNVATSEILDFLITYLQLLVE